jgi:hypothetical protein
MTAGETSGGPDRLYWVRILIGGFLAEALLILIVIPINLKFGQHPLLYVAPVGSLVTCFCWPGGWGEESSPALSCTDCWWAWWPC